MFFLLLALAAPDWAQTAAPVKKSEQELSRIRGRIQALQGRLDKDRGRKDEQRYALEQTERQIAQSLDQVRGLRDQVDKQQQKVAEVQQEKQHAQAVLDDERSGLARQLRAAYLIGQRGEVRLLLNLQNAQKVERVLTYYNYLNKARGTRMNSIFGKLDAVRAVEDKLRSELDALTELKEQQEQLLAALKTARSVRRETLKKLEERIADAIDEMKELQGQEKNIQSLLEGLRDVLADIPLTAAPGDDKPFPLLRGKLQWPARGRVLASYGQPKADGKLAWNGLWIAADEGDAVRAVARGRVAYVGWMQRYGLIVILEHENGYYTLYGHLSRAPLSEGETLAAGDTLAFAGSTGGHPQAGIYFELRKGRDAINPGDWLVK